MLLAHAMDAGSSLLVIAHGIIQRVEDHGGGRRQRNTKACRGDLADEHPYRGIILKGFDLDGAVGHAAVDQRVSQLLFLEQLFDGVNLREKPGDDHHLVAVIFCAIQQI